MKIQVPVVAQIVAFAVTTQLIVCSAMAESKTIRLHAQRPAGYMSSNVSVLGDIPGHELAHRVFSLTITSDDPDFNGFQTINYVQADDVTGTGTYRGYATWPLTNGDTVYIKFDGVSRKIPTDGGAWETPYEGRFEFVRGTGKYARIKGDCHYGGVSTAEGSFWDAVVEIHY